MDGFLCFPPILGSAITIVLGLTRANIALSVLSITLGKVLRYIVFDLGCNLLVLVFFRRRLYPHVA